ncbi:MAG: tRNA (adenosine(37)-N6)-threonylcarbamoyltransferase complex dimerization subunit type 1 TsaB, partial [Armatimonadetes bacterium]|nr:tRNA (adenosine(37)-N6)-threonylcarbamoyltransferase complex dimerization subunit type 1 TsaB [Armatimonadota bacterium]
MKCLALDTTTDVSSIALADESGIIAEYNFAHRMDLSRRLMPNIVALLTDCGMEMKDVEAIGVSIGPGSFTGLRIGVVTAKTLAQALSIPIAGVVTLDLLAHQFDYLPDAVICPLIKVRKGE